MAFDDLLDRCLAALEQGATVEECLALYPAEAKRLAPLLKTAHLLRSQPPLQLSSTVFERGRAALAAQARHHRQLTAPFLPPHTIHVTPIQTPIQTMPLVAPVTLPPPGRTHWQWRSLPGWGNLLACLLVLLTVITASRNITSSIPGSELYPLKQAGEELYGFLMSAAGQDANWHTRQLERRLYELDLLARQGAADAAIVSAVEQELQQALTASAALPETERKAFFARWLADLRAVHPGPDAAPMTTVTLGRIMTIVEEAAIAPPAPTVLDTATPTTAPTQTPTLAPSMTATPQDATVETPFTPAALPTQIAPTASPGMVLLPTVTPTAPLATEPTSTATKRPPTATPTPLSTATPTQQAATVTQTATPLPADDDDDKGHRDSTATPMPTATATLLPTVTPTPSASPTHTLATSTPTSPVATVTDTPDTPTETATETPHSGETATPLPTTPAVVTETPTPTAEETETAAPTETATVVEETPTTGAPTATQAQEPTRPPVTPIPTETPPSVEETPAPSATEAEATAAPTESATDEPTSVQEGLAPDWMVLAQQFSI